MPPTSPSLAGRLDQIAGFAVVLLLLVGCVLVLRPFFSPLLWAVVLSFSTWPVYGRLRLLFHDRRSLAALVMTLLLAAAFVLPLVLVGASLADNAQNLVRAVRATFAEGPPQPPAWLEALPWLGPWLASSWRGLAADPERLASLVQPLFAPLRDLAVASGVTVGTALLQMSMSVLAAYFFYRDGDAIGRYVRAVADRVAGARAQAFLTVAQNTVRGIVYGTVGTAIIQGGLAVVGFLVAGVPGAFLLGFATFILALFPVGAPLVWIPVAVWLYAEHGWAWGLFMALWGGLVISGADNFVRPYLISRGSQLPFLVVFMGVIGGAVAFGFLGIFLGPTLLALGIALVREWMAPPGESRLTAAEGR